MIGQILEYITVVTKAEFLFMIQSVNLPSSTHCSTLQPSAVCSQPSSAQTAAAITSSVHTAAMYSHVQLSAANLQSTLQPTAAIYNHLHCNYTIQCTLQLYHPVHTAATLSIQCIQCTSGPPQGKPSPLLAYLQSSQQTLMVDCSSP